MLIRKSVHNEIVNDLENELDVTARFLHDANAKAARLEAALRTILEQRTKAPNATVHRILTIAEQAVSNGTRVTYRYFDGTPAAVFGAS